MKEGTKESQQLPGHAVLPRRAGAVALGVSALVPGRLGYNSFKSGRKALA